MRGPFAHEISSLPMTSAFDELLDLARKLGITVRPARLGGAGGGLARFQGQAHLFIDLDASAADQLDQTLAAMAPEPGLENLFVRPDVRELLNAYRSP